VRQCPLGGSGAIVSAWRVRCDSVSLEAQVRQLSAWRLRCDSCQLGGSGATAAAWRPSTGGQQSAVRAPHSLHVCHKTILEFVREIMYTFIASRFQGSRFEPSLFVSWRSSGFVTNASILTCATDCRVGWGVEVESLNHWVGNPHRRTWILKSSPTGTS